MIVLIGSVAAEEREEISVSSANWVADLGASRFEVHWDYTGMRPASHVADSARPLGCSQVGGLVAIACDALSV